MVSLEELSMSVFNHLLVAAPETCKNHRKRLDNQMKLMFQFGDRSLVVPRTLEDVEDKYCVKIASSIERTRRIVNTCLQPFPKQIVGLLAYGLRKENRRICPDEVEKQKAITHFACIGRNLSPFHDSMDRLIDRFEMIRDSRADKNLILPYVCCYFHEFTKVNYF